MLPKAHVRPAGSKGVGWLPLSWAATPQAEGNLGQCRTLVAKKCPLAFWGILCNVAVPPAPFWWFQRTPQSSFLCVTVPFLCTWLL